MSDVFSRDPWNSQTTLALVVFAQLRKYATIVRGLCAAVRGLGTTLATIFPERKWRQI
jgi:hypothetical protein